MKIYEYHISDSLDFKFMYFKKGKKRKYANRNFKLKLHFPKTCEYFAKEIIVSNCFRKKKKMQIPRGFNRKSQCISDGLIDCADPECCSNHICRSSQLCVSAPKPIDILLRKQPPAITASFFERMKFLIDEGSLQNYARQETFNER